MILKVEVTYRDDTKKVYDCNDFPFVGDWITLYLPNFRRELIPKDAVASITHWIHEEKEETPSI